MTTETTADTAKPLGNFYTAVSRAQALGYFKGHHGPMEETAWIHVALHNLEEAGMLADEAIKGDVRQLSRLRTLLEKSPQLKLTEVGGHHLVKTEEKAFVNVHHAPPVAAAALLIDRLQNKPSDEWMRRGMGYYAGRALAVSEVLKAAEQALAGKLSLEDFAAAVKKGNFVGGEGHDEGHAGAGQVRQVISSDEFVLEAERAGIIGVELDHIFRSLLDIAAWEHSAPDSEVLKNLAASHHFDEDCCGCLRELAEKWNTVAPQWKEFLFQPLQGRISEALLRPVPTTPQGVSIPRHQGGEWEVPDLTIQETDELCPPAQAIKDLSSKVYGWAGAELIKTQNQFTKVQQCLNSSDTKKCKRKEDHGYNKCTEERDEGYNKCAREEDRGHNECCDWWPCSWACDAWVWIKNIVCVAYEWISNIVCVAWTWIKKMVCVAWEYIKAAACAIVHLAGAAAHAAAGVAGIGVGAAARTTASLLDAGCKIFQVKPTTHTVKQLKVVGIHVAVLHTNKVLLFAYDEGVHPVSATNPADFTAVGDSDRGLSALWDPAAKTAKYIPLSRNLFCAHHSFTEHGNLFVAGGQFPLPGLLKSIIPPKLLAPGADKDIHIFDPVKETWTRRQDMERGRWYPTCVTLPSGKIFISSGTNGYATEAGLGRGIQDTWQVADPLIGDPGAPKGFGHHLYHLFPFQHVLSDGRVFIHFKRTTILFNPLNEQRVRVAASGRTNKQTGETRHLYSRTGPGPGTCCLLPLIPKHDPGTGKIEYPAPRILILGGGGAEKEPEPADPTDEEVRADGTTGYKLHSDVPATRTAEILDFSTPNPEWVFTQNPMHNGRVMPDSILLPNAKVLIIGGGRFGQSGGLLAHFTSTDTSGNPDKGATDPVLEPELFDPENQTWTLLARKPFARLYHTTAVLLPDARVLVAGHDGALNMPPYDTSRYELEIFSPPYLFGDDGKLASRPVITDAPAEVPLGRAFAIATPDAAEIVSAALIRQSSTTHQINSDQRYVGLAILDRGRGQINVHAPPAGGVAPPGFYMLFIVNRAGVPSDARWTRVPSQP